MQRLRVPIFLSDAAATCGSPDMFSDSRTFATNPGTQQVTHTYACIDDYLNNLPEYRALAANQAADRRYVATMRQIDTARATGALTAEQAKAQAQAARMAQGGQ